MKIITKTYEVYTLEELSEEAKERALKTWINNNDYYFLSDYLNERLHELLKEKGIKDTNDTSKAGTKPTQVHYSLSYCQGDGAMFEGNFVYTHKKKKYTITVKHSGHYYHYNSKNIYVCDEEGEEVEDGAEYREVEKAFNDDYVSICKELERLGYDFIEYEDSMEAFAEACDANGYTFTKDGKWKIATNMQQFFDTLEILTMCEQRYIKGHAMHLLQNKNAVMQILEEYEAVKQAQKLPTIR